MGPHIEKTRPVYLLSAKIQVGPPQLLQLFSLFISLFFNLLAFLFHFFHLALYKFVAFACGMLRYFYYYYYLKIKVQGPLLAKNKSSFISKDRSRVWIISAPYIYWVIYSERIYKERLLLIFLKNKLTWNYNYAKICIMVHRVKVQLGGDFYNIHNK